MFKYLWYIYICIPKLSFVPAPSHTHAVDLQSVSDVFLYKLPGMCFRSLDKGLKNK